VDASGKRPPSTAPFPASFLPAGETARTDTPLPTGGPAPAPTPPQVVTDAPEPGAPAGVAPRTHPLYASHRPDTPQSAAPLKAPALGITALLAAIGGWALGRPSKRVPRGLAPQPPGPLFEGGPVPAGPARAWRAAEPERLLERVLSALSRTHRVVLVAPPGSPAPVVGGGPVYVATERDRLDVEAAVRALRRAPGPPIAVVLLGAQTLQDPGAVAGDPVRKLADALPADVWTALLLLPGDTTTLPLEAIA
jgi:hypothetical protein